MAWYDDTTRRTYMTTYKSDAQMRSEIEVAARRGFVTQTVTRKGKEWSVAFYRDESALTRAQLQEAVGSLHQDEVKLQQTKSNIETLQSDIQSKFRAARTQSHNPILLEQALLKSITQLVTNRNAAIRQRQLRLMSLKQMTTLREHAETLKATIPEANIDIHAEEEILISELDAESETVQREQSLLQVQQVVVVAVQKWQKVVGDRWRAHASVAALENRLQPVRRKDDELALSLDKSTITKYWEAQGPKRKAKLESLDASLQSLNSELLRTLEARDRRMAEVAG